VSKLHALEADGDGLVRVVLHSPCPEGANWNNVPWRDVFREVGILGVTSTLPVDNGIASITTEEARALEAGDLAEFYVNMELDSWDFRTWALELLAEVLVEQKWGELKTRFGWYGYVVYAVG